MSSLGLGVKRIFYLQPSADRGVRSGPALRHHAFEIVLAHRVEQINAPALDVFPANHIRQLAFLNDGAQLFLPFDQRKLSQVSARVTSFRQLRKYWRSNLGNCALSNSSNAQTVEPSNMVKAQARAKAALARLVAEMALPHMTASARTAMRNLDHARRKPAPIKTLLTSAIPGDPNAD